VLRDGDHFGEIALLKAVRRTATVRTLTDCVFLTLRRDEFGQLLEKAPSVRARLERILDQRASREEFAPLQRIAAASAAEPA
jgi:ATP-binding cassette subfamily B protein